MTNDDLTEDERASAADAKWQAKADAERAMLDDLRRKVPVPRWDAFMALAECMLANPQQRIGQTITFAVKDSPWPFFYIPDDALDAALRGKFAP